MVESCSAYANATARQVLRVGDGKQFSKPETIIFLMRSDPEPNKCVTFTQAKRAIACSDPHHANAVAAFFEM